jgi:hypothetical protein
VHLEEKNHANTTRELRHSLYWLHHPGVVYSAITMRPVVVVTGYSFPTASPEIRHWPCSDYEAWLFLTLVWSECCAAAKTHCGRRVGYVCSLPWQWCTAKTGRPFFFFRNFSEESLQIQMVIINILHLWVSWAAVGGSWRSIKAWLFRVKFVMHERFAGFLVPSSDFRNGKQSSGNWNFFGPHVWPRPSVRHGLGL